MSGGKFSISVAKKLCFYRAFTERLLAYAKIIFSQSEACI